MQDKDGAVFGPLAPLLCMPSFFDPSSTLFQTSRQAKKASEGTGFRTKPKGGHSSDGKDSF